MTRKLYYFFPLLAMLQVTFAWPTGDNSDQANVDDTYESLTAAEKENILFEKIKETEGTKGTYSTYRLLSLFTKDLSPSVDNYSDFVPYDGGKAIHSVGAVGKMKFKIIDENESNPFTGLFAEGAAHGMIRMSLALSLKTSTFVPGVGVKLFRDGMPSANFVAMEGVEGQESGNFFERDFSTNIAAASTFTRRLMEQKFARTYKPPGMVGLSDIASFDEKGNQIAPCEQGEEPNVVFPYELVMKPNPMLKEKFSDAPATEKALEEALLSIPEGTEIYDIYARAEPQDADLIKLGTFELTSKLMYSKFGDNNLFFRHQRITDDFELRPEWDDSSRSSGGGLRSRSGRRSSSKCPMLNR